ncbi:MAG: glucose 1-dehydrogenase [Myxococcota bacterium]
MQDFDGKTVLITGAASGFGKLLAEKLSAAGARLALGDLDAEGLEAMRGSLPGEVLAERVDVTREDAVAAFVAATVERFGGLDIAVNNAGIASPMKALVDTTEADLDLNFAVNAKGVFFGMKHELRAMLDQGHGCILNVASMAGLGGAPKLTAYAAAKHAVVGMTKTAAVEVAKRGIRVNAVCPFYSPTPMVTELSSPEMQATMAKGAPMKRLGDPEEMVNAMLLLIDPANTYMTGQAVAVDGGVSAL